ncbi:MAG TPA: prepilin-type N-terminal cleavage/methylation domain-containing protein [Sedimentisphaerales bacterium]|nr:prepilin-type N-terminal cleavage/methylation domain-containing protein [Sedimentisphaerales bacterium]
MISKSDKAAAGFTIIELLLALAITALLLSAAAVAFNASISNYEENEQIFNAINKGRQALTRMTTELRTAGYHDPVIGLVAVDPLAPGHQCNFRTATGGDFTYEFRSAVSKLYLINNDTGQEYTLCDNVTAATFTKDPTGDGDCKSVQISLTVQSGNLQRKLSAAVVMRRNLK